MSNKKSAFVFGALLVAAVAGPSMAAEKQLTQADREALKAEHTALVKAGKVEPCFGAALKGRMTATRAQVPRAPAPARRTTRATRSNSCRRALACRSTLPTAPAV